MRTTMDWINFYSVLTLVALIVMGVFFYYVYDIMEHQNAAAPWPPNGPASVPDGWRFDSAGWAIVPAANLACTAAGTSQVVSYTSGWHTVGSAPSAWKSDAAPAPCAFNVGLLHKVDTDAAYTAIAAMVPGGVHKEDANGGFTTTGIVKADYRDGKVSLNFTIDPTKKDTTSDMDVRRKFCIAYGVFWDGVADPDEVRAVIEKAAQAT